MKTYTSTTVWHWTVWGWYENSVVGNGCAGVGVFRVVVFRVCAKNRTFSVQFAIAGRCWRGRSDVNLQLDRGAALDSCGGGGGEM